jgi:type VI secretion system protein ImpJ
MRDGSGRFVFDEHFIPPCVQIGASDRLMTMTRRLIDILEEKSKTIAAAGQTRDKFQAGFSAQEVNRFWFLHAINASLAPLRHLYLSKRGHPEELFSEFARLAGALCTFGLDSHPVTLPLYDHQHLEDCFEQLDQHIRTHLDLMVPTNVVSIPLRPTRKYFYEGEVADTRCLARSRWIFGIQSRVGDAELISRTVQLVKICSAQFVPELVKRALPGLALAHLPVPPSAIARKVESQYFGISKAGPCWDHIVQTKRVGVYVPGELPQPETELLVILEN